MKRMLWILGGMVLTVGLVVGICFVAVGKEVITITTVEQLQAMKNNLSAHYALGNNIDASATSGWNGGAGFAPVGTIADPFIGSLDGQGYKIYNLYINRPTTNWVGLFVCVGSGGVVKNVGLENENVSGSNGVGGLAGANGGTVSNCYSTGTVSGGGYGTYEAGGLVGRNFGTGTVSNCYSTGPVSGNENVGGLVAGNYNYATVDNCYSTGPVSGTHEVGGLVGYNAGTVSNSYSTGTVNGSYHVGGLVGYSDSGTVSNCYSTGPVSGGGSYVGGLVGYNSRTVSNCYSTGPVSGGGSYVGGLVGQNSGPMSSCYSTGPVSGGSKVGGLVGINYNGTVSNCYSTGPVSGGSRVGGLVGYNAGTVSNSFWDIETSGQATSAGGTGKTTAEMKTKSTFTDAGWDFMNVWWMDDAGIQNDGYPELRAINPPNTPPVASNLSISPESPKTNDNLVGSYTYSDVDGDPESGSEIRWYKNDVLQPDYNDQLTIPFSTTTKGEKWHFTVKPKDGTDFGELKTSPSVIILNSAPSAPNLDSPADGTLTKDNTPTLIWNNATDPDNDTLTYTLEVDTSDNFDSPNKRTYSNIPEGTDKTSKAIPDGDPLTDDAWYWRVSANDGTIDGDWSPQTWSINVDATPPTVISITVTPDPASALPPSGLEFKLIFSESMNTSTDPTVSYDPEGATGPQPCSSGSWSTTTNPNDTYTVYNDNEIDKTTGDGVATISVSGARDLAGNIMEPDTDDTFIINAKPITIQNEGASPLSFNPLEGEVTTISYVLSESAIDVDITIIDQVTELVVRNLVTDEPKDGGLNTIGWDGKNNEGEFVINPGEVKKYSATISAQSSVPGDQDEVTILNIEADSTIPVIRIISDDDPILRYLGENIATINYETNAPGDNIPLKVIIKIKDSYGNVTPYTFNNQPEGIHNWVWEAVEFTEGLYQYEISAQTIPPPGPPKFASPKTGTIVILDENNIEPPWSSADGDVKVNSSATGPTITITRLAPEEEPTDATKAILTADPSLYLQSPMYDIIADPETDFVPPAILTFSYDPALVGEIKDKLQIRYFDTATNSWVPVARQYIDIVNHQIIAEIDKLTIFALFTCDDTTPPVVTITSPEAKEYYHTTDGEPTIIDITYTAQDPVVDGISTGVVKEIVLLNGEEYGYGEIDLSTLVGENTLTIKAIDKAGNIGQASVKFTVVLVAQVTIKPEALKVTPGVLTAYVEFPEGYNVADIVDVTCDGALPESMMLNDDGTEMIIKFRRNAIEEALSQLDPPQTIDTEFKVRGTLQDAYGSYIFEGTDTIMKVLEGSVPPEKGKGKGRGR